MKKITLLSLISALSCSALVHAGGMGDQPYSNAGFIALEGGYTMNTIDNYNFNIVGFNQALASIKSSQHYTGILSAGMLFMMDDLFAVTSELGWGYYGRTTLKPDFTGFGDLTMQHTLTGFDALIGIGYIQPNYSLFLKGGALIQNMQIKTSVAFADPAFPLITGFTSKVNHTAALPEIKLGASYNFDSNWSLTGAYIFALGSTPKTTGFLDAATLASNLNSNNLNPTINALVLGVQYTC
ncbi:hypothetical protein [Legionella maioricensis]|uniref:Outer membrane protein OmpA-like transmembrane domain-containing protein n=1 Tax=Legionella maioricensis TaxID=2896528 RepID=A0A9X2CZA5_9GAMM|nr:hypothetical protein [Legionella maioricensis]MCL9683665.1 hypothetical protein [Legionella maioricensis]MCL9687687.1 hypothetical protein [Legionella maioricensis]